MKKRILPRKWMITALLLVAFLGGSMTAFGETSTDVKLEINGSLVASDVAPLIKNEYTLVPARAVFEALGGKVGWDAQNYIVTVSYDDTQVVLTIDSNIAQVNGENKTMQVPAEIIDDRTMIPVRFVGESLGFEIGWDDATRTVSVDSPAGEDQEEAPPVIYGSVNGISLQKGSSKSQNTIITITGDAPLTSGGDYEPLSLSEPDRFVVDFSGFTLGSSAAASQSFQHEDSAVSSVRANQMEEDVVRIVVDLKEATTPTMSLSSDKKTLTLTFRQLSTYFKPMDDGKLVVALDPGHGASTGGKRSPDGSLLEYEFNRAVAYKVRDLLQAQGVEVLMTVNGDEDTSLAERCEIANNSDADIFVSIHANAFGSGSEWTSPTGWEIYYYATSALGKQLAQSIHDATMPESGMKDRGIKTSNFYVIKNTVMPAVLIEHGFYTNEEEVELLKSDAWRSKMAQYDAQGIMDFFNAHM